MQDDKDRKKISIGEAIKIRNRQKNGPEDIKHVWGGSDSFHEDTDIFKDSFLDKFIDRLAEIKNKSRFIFNNILQEKKLPFIISFKKLSVSKRLKVFLTIIVFSVGFLTTIDNKKSDKKEFTTDQLGVSTAVAPIKELPIVESTPGAKLLFSRGKSQDDFEVVKVSPDGVDNVYAYVDTIGETDVKVSQQALPVALEGDVETGVKQLAAGFQATNVVKVDSTVIYHGFTEKNGGVQSIIFTKNDVLIFISAPAKLSDTSLAVYVSSLK